MAETVLREARPSEPCPATAAPVSIASVTLAAQAPEALAGFYERLGLTRLPGEAGAVRLGVGDATLLRLTQATLPAAKAAGLFHTALLLPSRAALGRWLAAMRDGGVAFTGAADHDVSEALYLDDPEGNGVEVYADRPAADWLRDGDGYAMTTRPMDVEAVLATGGGADAAMPAGTCVGHVHLRAADIAAAERLYVEGLGMAVTHRGPSAAWLGAGGYHHHLAVNAWAGPLPPREAGQPGLEAIVLRAAADVRPQVSAALAAATWRDPSGAALALEP
ncbi:VOC family protein [Rubrimonas cliftonensis]|uniref:Catechol 2,3-dioxygenase n=1 Tax=Rubrimonas cliftonensis TaxID=89524 RepID=A0A1H4BUJ8_9RHOB|nr:VOC family protein [Rubrimonas cliftonensis]SEA51798.1 catechol 2,3-dioxygenase [Rubrimonas cliftonensis]